MIKFVIVNKSMQNSQVVKKGVALQKSQSYNTKGSGEDITAMILMQHPTSFSTINNRFNTWIFA